MARHLHYWSRSTKFPVWVKDYFNHIQGIPYGYVFLEDGYTERDALSLLIMWNAQAKAMSDKGYEFRLTHPDQTVS